MDEMAVVAVYLLLRNACERNQVVVKVTRLNEQLITTFCKFVVVRCSWYVRVIDRIGGSITCHRAFTYISLSHLVFGMRKQGKVKTSCVHK